MLDLASDFLPVHGSGQNVLASSISIDLNTRQRTPDIPFTRPKNSILTDPIAKSCAVSSVTLPDTLLPTV